MNSISSESHLKLIEKVQVDRKSPLRILLAFFIFSFTMIILSMTLIRNLNKTFFDILFAPLIPVCFMLSLFAAIWIVSRIMPHKKGLTVYLNKDEILVDDGINQKKIPNRNLKAEHLKNLKIKIQNLSGQTLIIPIHVDFYDHESPVNLEYMFNLKFNSGSVVLIKTTIDITNKSSNSEVVKFPQA